eukprot:5144311-Amphidinium_carterae.1
MGCDCNAGQTSAPTVLSTTTAAPTATTVMSSTAAATTITTPTTTTTAGITTTTTTMALTCDALCGLTNNTYQGQGCAQWAEQQSCEASYISVLDVSMRCAWIECDGVCFAEGVNMLSGCDCASPSTTVTTTVTTTATTTLVPLTCDTLCNRLNNSRDGKDCAYWSDANACESSYMSMGDVSFACTWLACDASCFADGSKA